MKKFLIIIFFFAAAGILHAQEKQKPIIVISSSPDMEAPQNIQRLFINRLANGLIESGRYEVLQNREKGVKISQEEQSAYDAGIVDDAQQKEILGRATAADFACYVSIVEVFGAYDITCQVMQYGTTRLTASFSETAEGREGILRAATKIARQIATGRDLTKNQRAKESVCPKCCYDEVMEAWVDCDISNTDEKPLSHSESLDFCKNKGYGWRLPTLEELEKIFKVQNRITDENFVNLRSKDYWSSKTRNSYETYIINFRTGEKSYYSNNIENVFRCVRTE